MNYSAYLWDNTKGLYEPEEYEIRNYIQITQDDPEEKEVNKKKDTPKIEPIPLRRSARIRAMSIISDAKLKENKEL